MTSATTATATRRVPAPDTGRTPSDSGIDTCSEPSISSAGAAMPTANIDAPATSAVMPTANIDAPAASAEPPVDGAEAAPGDLRLLTPVRPYRLPHLIELDDVEYLLDVLGPAQANYGGHGFP